MTRKLAIEKYYINTFRDNVLTKEDTRQFCSYLCDAKRFVWGHDWKLINVCNSEISVQHNGKTLGKVLLTNTLTPTRKIGVVFIDSIGNVYPIDEMTDKGALVVSNVDIVLFLKRTFKEFANLI